MYSGKILLALAKAYRLHLLEGSGGYFNRLSDFYLRHDFPPEFTDKNPPPAPDDLIQEARKTGNLSVVNKLIDSLLDQYGVDDTLTLPSDAQDKALNLYYFPQAELVTLLSSLKEIGYTMGHHEPTGIPVVNTTSSPTSGGTEGRLSSVVTNGCKQLLEDFPFDKNVFVMMKFPNKSGGSATDLHLEEIWNTISLTLARSYGLRAHRADQKDYSQGGWLWDNVCIYMESSKYGIAVLENLSGTEFNPNVAIEFGYMKGLGRTVLLLKEHSFNNIRADLIGRIWKEFSALDTSTIQKTVTSAIEDWAVDIGLRKLVS